MTKNSKVRIVLFGSTIICAVLVLLIHNVHRHRQSTEAIVSLYGDVGPTTRIDDVAKLLQKREYESLQLQKISDTDLMVESPIELGAKNWVLLLKFKDTRLVFVHIQTADNALSPKNSPPDIYFAEAGVPRTAAPSATAPTASPR